MTMAHHWEQRIEKEEKSMLGENRRREHGQFVRERRRHPPQRSISLSTLPQDLQGIGSWHLLDRHLTTARQDIAADRRAGRSGGQLKLDFVTEVQPAHWVPGSASIVVHRPVFSVTTTDPAPSRGSSLHGTGSNWKKPAAGMDTAQIAAANAPARVAVDGN
eukprot:TRINITY_DN116944_c0_g1_i1.p1 TRINITY_DN116944_c0_g1~~TRINITY_DN116944_c0_g1_i1.p1  ORF type:complete len:178 (+),score=32.40 TRINITY_DN116944_c0_g1_i1:52-534(+)